jgi:Ribbon-helix-helix protein, copG family
MNRERFPTSGAGESAEVTVRLTRAELPELDRFCAESELTRSQVVRRALNYHLIQRAIGAQGVSRPQVPVLTDYLIIGLWPPRRRHHGRA